MTTSMENSEKLKLLGFWVSPTVARVEWTLGLKGIKDYVYVEEDVNKSPLLLQLNPVHKKVPVLVLKGKPIAESEVIVKYIDETWKNYPLFPQDPYEKARILSFAKFGGKLYYDAFTAMWSQGEEKEKVVESTIEEFEKIEEEIKGRKFFGGESLGYLDIALGWDGWLPLWEEVGSMKIFDPIKFPGTASWVENFLSQPVINENLPPKDRAVKYFQERVAFIRSVMYSSNLLYCIVDTSRQSKNDIRRRARKHHSQIPFTSHKEVL